MPDDIQNGTNGTDSQPSWQSTLPDALTVEHEGKTIPLRDHPFIKETPDVPTLARRAFEAKQEVSRQPIRILGKDAKPDDIAKFKQEVYKTGIFKAPPDSPDKYEVVRPAHIPEEIWSKEDETQFRQIAYEEGITAQGAKRLLEFEEKRFTDRLSNIKRAFETSKEEAETKVTAWATEKGISYKQAEVFAGSWLKEHGTPEQILALDASGLGDWPPLIQLIAQASMDTGEDISIAESATGGTGTTGAAQEDDALLNALNDPKSPEYQRWLKNDPEIITRREAAYRRKYGTKEFQPAGQEE